MTPTRPSDPATDPSFLEELLDPSQPIMEVVERHVARIRSDSVPDRLQLAMVLQSRYGEAMGWDSWVALAESDAILGDLAALSSEKGRGS